MEVEERLNVRLRPSVTPCRHRLLHGVMNHLASCCLEPDRPFPSLGSSVRVTHILLSFSVLRTACPVAVSTRPDHPPTPRLRHHRVQAGKYYAAEAGVSIRPSQGSLRIPTLWFQSPQGQVHATTASASGARLKALGCASEGGPPMDRDAATTCYSLDPGTRHINKSCPRSTVCWLTATARCWKMEWHNNGAKRGYRERWAV